MSCFGGVYAVAQGNVIVATAGVGSPQAAPLSVGRIPAGASVERQLKTSVGDADTITLELNQPDFTTASQAANSIDKEFGKGTATPMDSREIKVNAPSKPRERVDFISKLENLSVSPGDDVAKVIINARTGSVVMNQDVTLSACAVSHGNLGLIVATASSDEASLRKPETVTVREGVSLSSVVKSLNDIGASPQDLIAILQALKVSGSLKAELEVI